MATLVDPRPPQFGDLVKDISSLDYHKRRQILRRESMPRFLYKFRSSVSSDTSVDRLRDVIVRSRLWLSSPAHLNDPFDMSAKVMTDSNPTEIRKRFDGILKDQGMKSAERQEQLTSIMSQGIESLGLKEQKMFEDVAAATGVCSFAGDPLSILMWAHYGKNHTGFCFQFDVAQDFATFGPALPVKYSKDYPTWNWVNREESVTAVLLTKYISWEYEGERRIKYPERASQYLPFRPAALTGIIIGYRPPEQSLEQLNLLLAERSAARLPGPKIYRAFKHTSKYRLILKRV